MKLLCLIAAFIVLPAVALNQDGAQPETPVAWSTVLAFGWEDYIPDQNGAKPDPDKGEALTTEDRLTIENLQLKATLADRELKVACPTPWKDYETKMGVLGKEMQTAMADLEKRYPGKTLDAKTLTLVKKPAPKGGV